MAPPSETASALLRNAHQSLPAGGLERKLEVAEKEGRQLRVKLGLDPTAPDIHLGHTVVLQKLREFQDLGHRVVLIVGDYTARVGDPSGRSTTRPVLSGAEIDANAETYRQQAFTVLRDDPELLEVRRNGEWLDMRAEELFRLARVATVAQILERDDFAKRFAAQQPISVLETLYPLLQGYDSVAITADVELGGTDQTFNLLLGRDVQRAYGQPEQTILTMPILPGIDGIEKMSKSLGNHVGVTEDPDEQFGKTMRLPDEAMDVVVHAAGGAATAGGHGARATPSARWRGGSSRASTARRRRAAAEQHFDRAVRQPRGAGRGRRARLQRRERRGAPAGAHRRRVRTLALGRAPAAGAGRGQARRRGAGGGRCRHRPRPAGRPRAAGRQAPLPAPAPGLSPGRHSGSTARRFEPGR